MTFRFPTRFGGGLPLVALAATLAGPVCASAIFNVSTNVNVLRELDVAGNQLVVRSSSIVGGIFDSIGANDGAGNQSQVEGFTTGSVLSETFTLPTSRLVSSWQVQRQFPGNWDASSMTLSGLVGGAWVMLDNYTPAPAYFTNRTFSAASVTALKYVATGPNPFGGGTFYNLSEVKVFLDSSVAQPLYGRVNDSAGFNLLLDPGRIIASHNSTNNNALFLAGVDLGTASYAVDGAVNGLAYVRAATDNPGSPGADRAYVSYDFDQLYQMNVGAFGSYAGQPLGNWQVWTSALANPNPDLDSDWVLQYTQAGLVSSQSYAFNQPGQYQHLRFTWNVQADAFVELEVEGFVPEPSTAMLLVTGGLILWRRRRIA